MTGPYRRNEAAYLKSDYGNVFSMQTLSKEHIPMEFREISRFHIFRPKAKKHNRRVPVAFWEFFNVLENADFLITRLLAIKLTH